MTENLCDLRAVDSVVLKDEEQVLDILRRSVFGLWDVVNDLTRLTPARRIEFSVAIFGSARVPRDHWVHGAVRDLANQLALVGCAFITGGGPGLMEAANEGARLAGATASNVGIRVQLPFEQEVNPLVAESYEHRSFFSSLHHLVFPAGAFVVVPGGMRTVLELSTIWQLLQVRRVRRDTPLILIGTMWADFVAWARSYLLRPEFELAAARGY